jgi:hypothetical protein
MDKRFREHIEKLHPSFERLMAMPPVKVCALPRPMPAAGVYLFSEGARHLYVGRTDRLRQRLGEHCRPSSTHNSAPFAFLLAREATGNRKPTYQPTGSRAELAKNLKFGRTFTDSKKRVREMDVRFVEEIDSRRQALLEMYAAIALNTPHNSFENH